MNSEESVLTGVREHDYRSINEEVESDRLGFVQELKLVICSSGILSISFFLQYFISVMAIYSAGRLGPSQLAAVQLAVSTFNVTGNAIYQGVATSLDAFCSRAYGQKKYHDVGNYFQKCACLMLCLTVPLACVWLNSGFLLSKIISDTELVYRCQSYLRIITFGAPGLLLFEAGKRFLLCQRIVNSITYILSFVVVVNLIGNYFLVWNPKTSIGFLGIPIVVVILYWSLPVFTLLYVIFKDGKQCWGGFSLKICFSNWFPLMKLAIPGIIMVEAEYLAFQALNFFAASFGTTALAAQSICSTMGSLIFQVNFSVSVLISTRIGHFIGSRDFRGADILIRIALILASVIGCSSFFFIIIGRHILAGFFTQDKKLLEKASKLLIYLAFNQFADSFNVICGGILRGQGRQNIGSIINLVCYYLIALPIGYWFAFHQNMKVFGLWYGLVLGVFVLSVLQVFHILRSDWNLIAKNLQEKSRT